jgi:hypothetical protein
MERARQADPDALTPLLGGGAVRFPGGVGVLGAGIRGSFRLLQGPSAYQKYGMALVQSSCSTW